MIYKPNDEFYTQEHGLLRCIPDTDGSCEDCVFNDEGFACPAKEYDRHPCYHVDRGDEHDVHFIQVSGSSPKGEVD